MRRALLFLALLCVALTARAEPAMWVVRGENATIYLVGTVHLMRPEMVWNAEKITKALSESYELWLELVDADNEAAAVRVIQKHGTDREKPLSKKLNAKQRKKLNKVANSYGMPAASLEPMQPWVVALLLTVAQLQKSGYDPKSGVDEVLRRQAEKQEKKISGLETMEEQVLLFAGLPEEEQIAFLDQTLDYAQEGVEMLDRLAKAWSEGNVDVISEIIVDELKEKSPSLYDTILTQRNIRWTDKIEELLRGSGTITMAVGAGHLAGPDSVQVQLEKRGIKVERH
jgi:uncharacterized protein